MENYFLNKNILITGASSGIGKACAKYFSEQGAIVVLVARNDEKLEEVSKELKNKSYIYSYDLNDIENIENIFEFCKLKGLKLDGMIHAAGILADNPLRVKNLKLMKEAMNVHCFSFAELGRIFAKAKYSNKNSSIIAISSISVKQYPKAMEFYVASKIALNSVVKTMSKEFVSRNIRVNAIEPGAVATKMIKETMNQIEGYEEKLNKKQPLGIIEPIYIAYLCEYLLSNKAKYTTGETILVSGGAY